MRDEHSFKSQHTLPFPVADVFAWHERPGALARLTPPWQPAQVLSRQGTIHDGDVTVLQINAGPLHIEWEARHFDFEAGSGFKDEQIRGPFAKWTHAHRFVACAGGTVAQDEVTYRIPGGRLAEAFGRSSVENKLHRLFAYRYAALQADLARHAAYQGPPLRVVVAGSSGLVGRALCAFLSTGGHHVVRLVRASSVSRPDAVGESVVWDPYAGALDLAALGRVDSIVNLAGENVAGARWTPERKRKLASSRVEVTQFLADVACRLDPKPKVLINASAMGFYGDRGDDLVDESSPRGNGFLADLCEAWEGATGRAADAGIRVVLPRISLVLTPEEGILAKMLPPFRAGVGGRLGSGQQWMSWMALDDLVGLFHRALFDAQYQGPVNACTPNTVRNEAFTTALGKALELPTFLPVPAFALKLALGEMGEVATSSTRMAAAALLRLSFPYQLSTLDAAFAHLLCLTPLPPMTLDEQGATVQYPAVPLQRLA